jgi:ankyrin repeat protein
MSSSITKLTAEDFILRAASIESFSDLQSLRTDALDTENLYRELFARRRESWEVPEIDDPYVFLIDVFSCHRIFRRLPLFPDDITPRCFALDQQRKPMGSIAVADTLQDFFISWDCFTEGLLRFLNWDNIFCAGGAVAGCLAPLPLDISAGGAAATRVKRRKYFHDTFLPGSDIDIFLYGLDQAQAEVKLLEIYDAVQAANPYEIRAFRSTHAVTLVSQYPFRHVQIILRLYNSPSEVLMGFDVDACAAGYNGKSVLCCPRTALAILTQTNTVDMSRRSPSYEMRLQKYAQRGYEVLVPGLDRDRVDPFLFEKRFDQTKGLARLLLLERLRTPEERLRYRLESQLKSSGGRTNEWMIQNKLRKATRDFHNLDRAEGTEGIVPPPSGAELSDYSTVYLPWGPGWYAKNIENLMKKKDKILNKIEILPNGKVDKCRRPYKVHVCAVGTMEEVIADPFPDDPLIPDDVPPEALEATVRGRLSWLLDNPGRQQIGSFHPITDADWKDGAYFSQDTEALIVAAVADDGEVISSLLKTSESGEKAMELLASRDFLGRSALHVAALARSANACRCLLEHANGNFLKGRLADGRTALHLAVMQGDAEITKLILEKRQDLMSNGDEEVLDIDGSDYVVKMSPLQYAVTLGHVEVANILLNKGADARKIAVHKTNGKSISTLALLALYASECGQVGSSVVKPMLKVLLNAGASPTQVDTTGFTCWHHLAASATQSSCSALETFVEVIGSKTGESPRGLDILDSQMRTPLCVATACRNSRAVRTLLIAGAKTFFTVEGWAARVQQLHASGGNPFNYRGARGEYGDNPLRFPIFMAAQHADGSCLEAFVSHDPSLANAVIQIPNLDQGRHYGSQKGPEKIRIRPLNLLENALSLVQGGPSSGRL